MKCIPHFDSTVSSVKIPHCLISLFIFAIIVYLSINEKIKNEETLSSIYVHLKQWNKFDTHDDPMYSKYSKNIYNKK